MTVSELFRECTLPDAELIKIYAKEVCCDDCPLKKKCTVKIESIPKCVDYLMNVLEVE